KEKPIEEDIKKKPSSMVDYENRFKHKLKESLKKEQMKLYVEEVSKIENNRFKTK
ncbi:relaxase, partial [Salmonella enterica]|nr:relaxase [Salmonella enterica]